MKEATLHGYQLLKDLDILLENQVLVFFPSIRQGTICNVLDGQLSVSNAPSLHTAMHTKVRVTQ